ncbi:hypothetical protein KD146_06100 [Devosia sp. BSSL-BM10]|uniref:Uncharacterized protein n=1 Tax=Devosia litorisediminis TaxID=2829817 RepID=A0A942EAE1_9HYPH|nr:hypothetical protein [Devosia litorisediminis]MBS3848265.1 hypothetical protein [Devosia litorisediminis]
MLPHVVRSVLVVALGWIMGAISALAHPPIISCPADQAVYRLQTEDGPLEIGFIPAVSFISAASDLYLYLTTTQRTYWFSFSVSNGYSGMTLHPVSDPAEASNAGREGGARELLADYFAADPDAAEQEVWASLRFYSLDSDLTFKFEPPLSGEPAPAYVMMPEIGLTLWYEPQVLTEDPGADRDPIPRGIFELTECLPAPRAKVRL